MGDLRPGVWTSPSKCHSNNISYTEALRCLADIAVEQKALLNQGQKRYRTNSPALERWPDASDKSVGKQSYEDQSVLAASGNICAQDVLSPCSTPTTDTSAMDGFAVTSHLTTNATADSPVRFRVAGMIAAGANIQHDQSFRIGCTTVSDHPCVEIMTGACFPEQQFPKLDAVVKVEDVELVEDHVTNSSTVIKYILVFAPVRTRQHRRPAGSDFRLGDLIIARGAKIEPKHVMALTSVGISNISVMSDSISNVKSNGPEAHLMISVGVLPTGSELSNVFDTDNKDSIDDEHRQILPDSNGPYISSAVNSMSSLLRAEYLGPCSDDEDHLVRALNNAIDIQQHDVLVTSGGVSMGRFDLVKKVIESRLDAEIIFHGCLVRPGAPVLFGVINRRHGGLDNKHRRMTAFIGTPGNPMATAMAVRFFLHPFLQMLQAPLSIPATDLTRIMLPESSTVRIIIAGQEQRRRKPAKAVAFLLAKHPETASEVGEVQPSVELLADQASYKIKPFLLADCWVVAPAGNDWVSKGDHGQSYSLW